MKITKLDIWLEKVIHGGWPIEDVPIHIRPEVEKALKEKIMKCNEWIKLNKEKG